MKRLLKRLLNGLDSLFEYLGLAFLSVMVLIVTWQVFSRYVLNTTPRWSEEITLVLMVWISFIGIAIGVRERLHIALEILARRLPEYVQVWLQRAISILTFLFGLALITQGWQFIEVAHFSTMPATGLPSSVLYAMVPISGIAVCIYTLLQVFGIRTEKRRADSEVAHL